MGRKGSQNRRQLLGGIEDCFQSSVQLVFNLCFGIYSNLLLLVQFHVPSRVCIDSLFEYLFWRMSVLYLLVKFFDFFSWFTAVIFFLGSRL